MSENIDTIQENDNIDDERDIETDADADVDADVETLNLDDISNEDIIYACIGINDMDLPKACFALNTGVFNAEKNEKKNIVSKEYYNPFFNLTRVGEFIMVDITYADRTDSEMHLLWSFLQKYAKDFENAMHNNLSEIPTLELNIIPIEFKGKFCLLAVSPQYFVLQPEHPAGQINTIRIVFSQDSVGIVESDGLTDKEIQSQIEREDMQRDFIEQAYEQAQEEEEEYQNDRNSQLEELRRNGEL